MELVFFIFAVGLVGAIMYFILCALFLLITNRPLIIAFSMAWKLPALSILGLPIMGIGGVALATVVFVTELAKHPNYNKVRDVLCSLIIASVCSVGLYFSTVLLAFEILE